MSEDQQDGRWGLVREGLLEEVVVQLVLKQNCEGKTHRGRAVQRSERPEGVGRGAGPISGAGVEGSAEGVATSEAGELAGRPPACYPGPSPSACLLRVGVQEGRGLGSHSPLPGGHVGEDTLPPENLSYLGQW